MKIKRGSHIRIEHNSRILWIIAVLIIALIFLVSYIKMQEGKENSRGDGNNAAGNSSAIECETDSGCVLQETGCCPCNMGGKKECMSIENATLYKEALKGCAKDIACIALYNCEFQGCICNNGKCAGVKSRKPS